MSIEFKIAEEDILRIQRGNSEKKINRVFEEVLSLMNGEMSGLTTFFDKEQTELPEILKKVKEEKASLLKKFTNKEIIGKEIKKYLNERFEELNSFVNKFDVIKLTQDFDSLSLNNQTIQTKIVFSQQHSKLFFQMNIYFKRNDFISFCIPIKKGKKVVTSFGKVMKEEKLMLEDCSKMIIDCTLAFEKKIEKSLNKNQETFFEVIKKLDLEKLYKMQQVVNSYYVFNDKIPTVTLRSFIKEHTSVDKVFESAESLIEEIDKTKDFAALNKDMQLDLITIQDLNNIIG